MKTKAGIAGAVVLGLAILLQYLGVGSVGDGEGGSPDGSGIHTSIGTETSASAVESDRLIVHVRGMDLRVRGERTEADRIAQLARRQGVAVVEIRRGEDARRGPQDDLESALEEAGIPYHVRDE